MRYELGEKFLQGENEVILMPFIITQSYTSYNRLYRTMPLDPSMHPIISFGSTDPNGEIWQATLYLLPKFLLLYFNSSRTLTQRGLIVNCLKAKLGLCKLDYYRYYRKTRNLARDSRP